MLGRVQDQSQLFIIDSLPVHRITTDKDALDQLAILKAKSINNNPPVWEKAFNKSSKVFSLNICSLRNKIVDVREDLVLPFGDIIVLSESWLGQEVSEEDPSLQIGNYKLHLNSYGSGKGLAIYYKGDKFTPSQDYKTEYLQISILQSQDLCVVGLYRSDANKTLAATLREVTPEDGSCLVTGDFNICSARYPDHEVFVTLRSMGFQLLQSRP